jgi:hypothetical protein
MEARRNRPCCLLPSSCCLQPTPPPLLPHYYHQPSLPIFRGNGIGRAGAAAMAEGLTAVPLLENMDLRCAADARATQRSHRSAASASAPARPCVPSRWVCVAFVRITCVSLGCFRSLSLPLRAKSSLAPRKIIACRAALSRQQEHRRRARPRHAAPRPRKPSRTYQTCRLVYLPLLSSPPCQLSTPSSVKPAVLPHCTPQSSSLTPGAAAAAAASLR